MHAKTCFHGVVLYCIGFWDRFYFSYFVCCCDFVSGFSMCFLTTSKVENNDFPHFFHLSADSHVSQRKSVRWIFFFTVLKLTHRNRHRMRKWTKKKSLKPREREKERINLTSSVVAGSVLPWAYIWHHHHHHRQH